MPLTPRPLLLSSPQVGASSASVSSVRCLTTSPSSGTGSEGAHWPVVMGGQGRPLWTTEVEKVGSVKFIIIREIIPFTILDYYQ